MTVDKQDRGKAPLGMLGIVAGPLAEVARVLAFGAAKYKCADNYKRVPDGRGRYVHAALRHIFAAIDSPANDKETGFSHLAHAACCCLMTLWFDQQRTLPGCTAPGCTDPEHQPVRPTREDWHDEG